MNNESDGCWCCSAQAINRQERESETRRLYRRALYLACGDDKALVRKYIEMTEEEFCNREKNNEI